MLLSPADHVFLMISVLSMYVEAFLSYEPKTRASRLFFRAARAPFALITQNVSYGLSLTITFLMISVSIMYVESFFSYSGNRQRDRQTDKHRTFSFIH